MNNILDKSCHGYKSYPINLLQFLERTVAMYEQRKLVKNHFAKFK